MLRYAPVGGGSYHWVVTVDPGEQWFVTVDDLDDKGWLGRPWAGGGPFTEPARALLAGAAGPVRRGLCALDQWASGPAAAADLVITHGEPHPGNIIRAPADGAPNTPGNPWNSPSPSSPASHVDPIYHAKRHQPLA
jgi:hypothetical protein